MPPNAELTISAAARLYDISRKALRRLLAEGAIEGARRRTGRTGPEWVFPAASLEALGYPRRPETVEDPDDDRALGRGGRRLWLIAGAVAFLALVPVIAVLAQDGDGSSNGEDPLETVTREVRERTAEGDEVGAVGDGALDLLPAGRVPVVIGAVDDVVGVGESPRYVVVADDGPDAVVEHLLQATDEPVLHVEEAGRSYWVVDRGAPAAPATTEPATTEPATTAPPETTAPPQNTAPPEAERAPPSDDADDDAPTSSPDPSEATPDTWEVEPGEHFWSIAEQALEAATGEAPTDAEITPYWLDLIEANADILVDAGNPDLLLPGQVLELPPLPAGP